MNENKSPNKQTERKNPAPWLALREAFATSCMPIGPGGGQKTICIWYVYSPCALEADSSNGKVIFDLKGMCPHVHAPLEDYNLYFILGPQISIDSSISASSLLVGFGELNDNTIKGLTSLLSVEQKIEFIAYTCGLQNEKCIQVQKEGKLDDTPHSVVMKAKLYIVVLKDDGNNLV